MAYHVQEFISRSGRTILSARMYSTVEEAYRSMRVRVRQRRRDYASYHAGTDEIVQGSTVESDYDSFINVVTKGNARRRFTIVEKRGGPAVKWGHLLDRK